MSLLSKQTIGIAIASVATASFATGFIGAEHALKQPTEIEIAQSLQPTFYDTAQRALWHGDIGLSQANQQVQLAKRQSAIAQSRYFDTRMPNQADSSASYTGESVGTIPNRSLEAMQSNQFQMAQDSTGEPLNAPSDPQMDATADGAAEIVPDASTLDSSAEQAERYTSESAEYSTSADYRLEPESESRYLKPDFGWSGSPEFIEDYIKARAIK